MNEHEAVVKARNSGDVGVLIACLSIIAGMLFLMIVGGFLLALMAEAEGAQEGGLLAFIGDIVVYGLVLVFLLVVILVTVRIMRQMFLGNMLQVEYSDFAWLRDWSNQVAVDLKMPRVEIFITQDPVINAFAIGFMRPYNIVLNSGSIRYLSKDELKAIVVHEMGHVKYNHTIIGTYLSVVRALPLIGGVCSWIVDFWSRRAELTADRLALCYLKDLELVKRALVKVHVGPDVASSFNDVARQWQAYNTRSTFHSFAQTFSNHPFLARRLQQLDRYAYLIQPPVTPSNGTMNVDAATPQANS